MRIDYGAAETLPAFRLYSSYQNAVHCRYRVVEVVGMRPESEALHRSLHGPYGENAQCVNIDEQPDMVLELAERVEGAATNTPQEEQHTQLNQRTPHQPKHAVGIEIESICNDRVATSAQNQNETFP